MLTWYTMYIEFMSSLPGQNTLQNWLRFPGSIVGRGNCEQVGAFAWCLRWLSTDKRGFRPPFLICEDCALTDGGWVVLLLSTWLPRAQGSRDPLPRWEGKNAIPAQRSSRLESWAGPCSGTGLCKLPSSLDKACEWWWREDARMLEGPTQEDHVPSRRLFVGLINQSAAQR